MADVKKLAEGVHTAVTSYVNARLKNIGTHTLHLGREIAAQRKIIVDQDNTIRELRKAIRTLQVKLQVIDWRTAPPPKAVKLWPK